MDSQNMAMLDESNFEREVLSRQGLTLVDFWSESCVPCKQLGRVLGQLAEELPAGVRIGTVNVESNPHLSATFGVSAVPTLMFFKDGTVVETRTGVDRRQVLKKLVEQHA